jgi:hypothetical protein
MNVMSSLRTLYWLRILFDPDNYRGPDSKAPIGKTHTLDQTALCTGVARETHKRGELGRVPIIIGIGEVHFQMKFACST